MLVADSTLRICYALLYYDSAQITDPPTGTLDRELMLRHLPQSMAQRGHKVSVVRMYPRRSDFVEGDVDYAFVPSSWWARTMAATAAKLAGVEPARSEWAMPAIRRILSFRPEVIHFFGTNLTLTTWMIFRAVAGTRIPVVVAHHGGNPPAGRFHRAALGYGLSRAASLTFTATDHAKPFFEAGLIDGARAPISEIMEVSTVFRRRDRAEARRETKISGDPVFVWGGRLEPVKDPMTALKGFDRIRRSWHDAQFYLYYLTDDLLPQLKDFVNGRPHLADCVHFRGRIPHDQMEQVFNSADFLLQSSRPIHPSGIVEYSGYVPLEAMACGVIPVLTDIPSFRTMTADGRFGRLFPCGDDAALARAVLDMGPTEIAKLGLSARAHFEREFSFSAMARKLESVYLRVRNGRSPG